MDITHNLMINASPATVYNAVATKKGINGWWSKDCQVGEAEGEKSLLKFDKAGTIVEMGFRTLKLVPNENVIWECIENGNPAWLGTQIVTEITPAAEGCRVVFSHKGFDEKWKGHDAFEMTKGGWEHFVKSLISFCEKGAGEPW
ncbi:MAG: hypothetical protein DHS20C17_20850 [Cyclobacteriaceae bacterium]|nr:MAG: hypothetical protein DHS20C17_20850 [Cyclobacteriaceae bacterium]